MAAEWAIRKLSVNDLDADEKLTAFAAQGWTVHSTSTYWDTTLTPDDAATLVIVAHRETAAEPAVTVRLAAVPNQERWTHDEAPRTPRQERIQATWAAAMSSGESFEQRFERWSDDVESWEQAVLVAV